LPCLALAACYRNDLYREATMCGIEMHRVEVEVEATFGAEGAAAERLAYHARVSAKASRQEIGGRRDCHRWSSPLSRTEPKQVQE